ncbi:hypothetical protein AVEN_91879-1 [Araneus ventricosus]|uniref:Uncharacterized protein n=1 Tax=Araneus ventricosus TaxID=182803 RepID=A0A4Y2NXB5_ARAVE|nr:hypothetical protein AVEN_91879-1 [Araneus ventricosus]
MEFGKIVNRDGALHYTVEVQGTLVRRHVDQIRPVDDQVQNNDFVPNLNRRFSATDVRENNSNFSMLRHLRIFLHESNKKNRVLLPHQQCHQLIFRLRTHHPQMFSRIVLR